VWVGVEAGALGAQLGGELLHERHEQRRGEREGAERGTDAIDIGRQVGHRGVVGHLLREGNSTTYRVKVVDACID